MTKVNFYHLTKLPVGKALPKLLEKVILSGVNVVVLAPTEENVELLNRELWTYTTKFFLPHGSKKDGNEAEQPVYLTASNENPNSSKVLAIVGDANPTDITSFEKCLYMFDGNVEEQVSKARQRWKEYKQSGHELTYWQQDNKGAWQQNN